MSLCLYSSVYSLHHEKTFNNIPVDLYNNVYNSRISKSAYGHFKNSRPQLINLRFQHQDASSDYKNNKTGKLIIIVSVKAGCKDISPNKNKKGKC